MRAKIFFTIILAILLAAPMCWADAGIYQERFRAGFEDKLSASGNWYLMAVYAILICLLFNILVYMMGYALSAENLKKYAKEEFLQTTASALMIFWAVALLFELSGSGSGAGGAFLVMEEMVGASSTISCGAVPGNIYRIWTENAFGGGPIGAFKCRLQEKITALDQQYGKIYAANMATERLASSCVILFGFPIYCFDWDASIHGQVEQAHLLATKITSLLMPLHAQYVLAEYIQKNMLSVFLPLGLILRILPPTRGVGGLFIAIAIGFFFIWPTFTVLTDPTFVKSSDQAINDRLSGMCLTGFNGISVVRNSVLGAQAGAGDSLLANAEGEALLYETTVGALFYPFIAFVVTLIFIRAATPLLGGDMGELMKMFSRLG